MIKAFILPLIAAAFASPKGGDAKGSLNQQSTNGMGDATNGQLDNSQVEYSYVIEQFCSNLQAVPSYVNPANPNVHGRKMNNKQFKGSGENNLMRRFLASTNDRDKAMIWAMWCQDVRAGPISML